jgi:1,4-alpha-glucan branching enzyme
VLFGGRWAWQAEGVAETATVAPVDPKELQSLVEGTHHDPHAVLGPHPYDGSVTVRVFRPWAERVTVLTEGRRVDLEHEYKGVFAGALQQPDVPDYRLEVAYPGFTVAADDPYRYLPTLGDIDLHLIGEGRHEQLWQVLGSHVQVYEAPTGRMTGTSFAVWAPNARGVRVVGDFNYWEGRAHPMRSMGSSGVWELFVPEIGTGTQYKYEILGRDGVWRQKADPVAFSAERPPATASVVFESAYTWGDEEWMEARAGGNPHRQALSIYEVHLGSWRAGLSYRQLADELVPYVADLGFTHVELMPVAEHPYGGSWGYQVSSYFAPTARYGTPDDFRYLVDRFHQMGIGVLVDWVPAHFPRDTWALARFDGTPLYEHADPRRGEHPDWGTLVFDYGRREVRNFLVANALYWLEEFHLDGLRVDAVASMLYLDYSRKAGEWVPNPQGGRENLDAVGFLQEMNATVYQRVPGVITVAEESTAWPGVTKPTSAGGLGFGFKWNMGWMHDTLGYLSRDPIYRAFHHNELTFSLMYAYTESFILPLSHDEVVHGKGSLLGKMPGDRWRKLAQLRALYAYMWAHPGGKLLFMGGELGQEAEWSEGRSLDWWLLDLPDHTGLQAALRDLNNVYVATPALWSGERDPSGFQWLVVDDAEHNVVAFVRYGDKGAAPLACVANFSAVPYDYHLGLPFAGVWREVVNTDAELYGGSGVGNLGSVTAVPQPHRGQPASATLRLPPLGALWLSHSRSED